MKQVSDYVRQLDLKPHPEGGYFNRIYSSNKTINTPSGPRSLTTSIHYLLQSHDYSAWHRIKSDELWYFHQGIALTIHTLHASGGLESTVLSADSPHLCVPADTWFCAEIINDEIDSDKPGGDLDFCLVSCVVTPGFDFKDFEMGNKEELVNLYPQHRDIICRLCRE